MPQSARLTEGGGGGIAIWAMPERKRAFPYEVFPYITKAILNDENSTKSQNLPPKSNHLLPKFTIFY